MSDPSQRIHVYPLDPPSGAQHVIDRKSTAIPSGRLITGIFDPKALIEHVTDGNYCWCQPLVEPVLPDGLLIIHRRSLDSPHIEVES